MYKRYKHLVIDDPDEPPTPEEIIAIEMKLGAKLPADFLDFLEVGNGGSIDDYFIVVPLIPKPEIMSFGRLFTTKTGYSSFLGQLEYGQKYLQTPDKVLPIAEDGGSSRLYLDLRKDGVSPVTAFIHGLPAWTGLHEKDEIIKVADNFSEYLDMLKFDAEEYEQLLRKALSEKNTPIIANIVEYLDLALPDWRQMFGINDIG